MSHQLVTIYSSIPALPFKKLRVAIHLSYISKENYCTYTTQCDNVGSSDYKRVVLRYGLWVAGCGNEKRDSFQKKEGGEMKNTRGMYSCLLDNNLLKYLLT